MKTLSSFEEGNVQLIDSAAKGWEAFLADYLVVVMSQPALLDTGRDRDARSS